MSITKTRKRYYGILDLREKGVKLFHLNPEDFPGISFEYYVLQPGECSGPICVTAEKIVVDHRGKLRLDQNDGTLLPLANLPDELTGKLAEVIVLDNDVETGQTSKLNFVEGSNVTIQTSVAGDKINITISASTGSTFGYTTIAMSTENTTWVNQPSAVTEFLGQTYLRTKLDLTGKTQVRLTARVLTVGNTNAQLRLQWSTDESTWYYFSDVGVNPYVLIDSLGTNVSSWVSMQENAKDDVFIRLVGANGDGVKDPQFGLITCQFK